MLALERSLGCNTYNVVVGRHDLASDDGEVIPTKEKIPHPRYDKDTTDGDWMLVLLERPTAGDRSSCRETDEPDGSRDVQIRVVSWGVGCTSDSFLGVYSRVSRVNDWIVDDVCGGSSALPVELCGGSSGGVLGGSVGSAAGVAADDDDDDGGSTSTPSNAAQGFAAAKSPAYDDDDDGTTTATFNVDENSGS